MSTLDQDQPSSIRSSSSPAAARRPGRMVVAAVLLAGTTLGGYALGHRGFAAEPAAPAQDHVIRPTPPAAVLPDFSHMVKQVEPAVVSITAKLKPSALAAEMPQELPQLPFGFGSPFGFGHGMPRHEIIEARGSGFIINSNGWVVTNNHVVQAAKSVSITMADGTTLPAKIVGTDPRTDLALLKVNAGRKLPYVELGDSSTVEPGQWVIAIGNPFGLGDTVTAGIVSARGRDIGSGPYDNFIQVDAPINKGNSAAHCSLRAARWSASRPQSSRRPGAASGSALPSPPTR
jgi:serine protease Do